MLNAVWRHWIVHTWVLDSGDPLQKCSTPFGVIGLFTEGRFTRQYACLVVLNAVWRHWIVHHPAQRLPGARHDVLNAVWRHWIVHESAPAGICREGCGAQRRLASLDCSHKRGVLQAGKWSCAQRRLASLDCSRTSRVAKSTGSDVLNAVWRHWIVHLQVRPLQIPHVACSTPFGVIGLFTRLYALYHTDTSCAQRRLASLDCSLLPQLLRFLRPRRCSTPFGVIGLFTLGPR